MNDSCEDEYQGGLYDEENDRVLRIKMSWIHMFENTALRCGPVGGGCSCGAGGINSPGDKFGDGDGSHGS